MPSSIYASLDSPLSSFRLLGLHVPSGRRSVTTNESDLQTPSHLLRTFALDEAPPYFALSHRWSDEPSNTSIVLNGMTAYITRSLADGIRQLQTFCLENTGSEKDANHMVWVWIDTICINQDDPHERSEQVRIMRHIYSQALRTLIWLGTKSYTKAWVLVDQIYDVFERTLPGAKTVVDIPLQLYTDRAHAVFGLPPWDSRLWQDFREFLELSWFKRTWIIQEVVLSREDPIFLLGDQRHSWDRLGWVASWLRRNGYMRLSQIPAGLRNVEMISNMRRSKHSWNLDALLVAVSTKCQATDQRDKVYGLLGLASECFNDIQNTAEALRPNYDADVIDVYTRIGRFLIQSSNSLAILTRSTGVSPAVDGTERKYSLDGLPTWVPNWCDFDTPERELAKSLAWLDHTNPNKAPQLGFPKHYRASTGLQARILDTPTPGLLSLVGLKVDTILRAIYCEFDSQNIDGGLSPLARLWEIALQHQPKGTDLVEHLSSWVKVTTADHHELGGATAEQEVRNGAAYLLDHWKMATSERQEVVDLSVGGDSEAYESLARNFCFKRKFIITTKGRMGIGPKEAESGDIVAVLFGGGLPYILRGQGQSFVLVGESYINDLSDGEAVQAWENGESAEQVFTLE